MTSQLHLRNTATQQNLGLHFMFPWTKIFSYFSLFQVGGKHHNDVSTWHLVFWKCISRYARPIKVNNERRFRRPIQAYLRLPIDGSPCKWKIPHCTFGDEFRRKRLGRTIYDELAFHNRILVNMLGTCEMFSSKLCLQCPMRWMPPGGSRPSGLLS